MPQLEFFVVAGGYSVDQRSDRLSIFDVLEQLRPRRFPVIIPRLSAISGWIIGEEERAIDFQVGIRISSTQMDPNRLFTANFRGEKPRRRIMLTLVGLRIERPGAIAIELSLNGAPTAHHTVTVADADPNMPEDDVILHVGDEPGG